MGLNLGEGLLITAIITLFFGGKKIPELGRTFGASIKGFKEGMKEDEAKKEQDDKNKKS